jgi:hypothetical protein
MWTFKSVSPKVRKIFHTDVFTEKKDNKQVVNRAAGNSLKQVLLVALLLIRSHLYGDREGTL